MRIFKITALILLFASCSEGNKNSGLYKNALNQNHIEHQKYVVVVPGAGCGGCISNATYFLVNNYSKIKDSVTIVFTGVMDKKLLKNEVGEEFLKNSNVKIDQDNYFLAPEIVSNYPQVISFKGNDGEIGEIQNFDDNTYNSIIQ